MNKIFLILCLLASVGAFAQDTTKAAPFKQTEFKFSGKRPGLVMLDGKPYQGDIDKIAPASIESISVLNGKDATKLYGPQGKDGVVLIISKKGGYSLTTTTPRDTVKLNPTAALSGDPLYIIDGKKADKASLQVLNPNDIESISVYKNADAIAPYGDEGKNGVIKITTKASTKKLKN